MENFLHHEIPEGQQEGNGGVLFQNNIQLGMVRTFFVNPPEMPTPSEKSWLAPKPVSKDVEIDKTTIHIPTKWPGFFQALLLASAQHKWARQLLESNFAQHLHMDSEWSSCLHLPNKPIPSRFCSC
jgi:hypothetical protein